MYVLMLTLPHENAYELKSIFGFCYGICEKLMLIDVRLLVT